MSRKALFLALVAAVALPVLAQDKSITFDNLTPSKTVRLQNGGTLAIGVDGNVTAKCLNADADAANCDDIGTAAGATPAVSLASSAFTQTADVNGAYPAGTIFTLTPTVSGADACVRLLEAGTPVVGNWAANSLLAPPVPAATITLPTINANYGFLLRCYGAGGATTSAPVRVTTNANSVGGGTNQCNAGAVTPPAFPPSGFERNSAPDAFTDLVDIFGSTCQDFPNTGGGQCRLNSIRNKYTSIQFVVPPDGPAYAGLAKTITWNENQSDGAANENRVYLSISQCPGDFRIPTTVAPPNPTTDPTYSLACRNFNTTPITTTTFPLRLINYNLTGLPTDAGGEMRCGLTPGNVYYLNFILANPEGGINPGEHNCRNGVEFCGLQVKVE